VPARWRAARARPRRLRSTSIPHPPILDASESCWLTPVDRVTSVLQSRRPLSQNPTKTSRAARRLPAPGRRNHTTSTRQSITVSIPCGAHGQHNPRNPARSCTTPPAGNMFAPCAIPHNHHSSGLVKKTVQQCAPERPETGIAAARRCRRPTVNRRDQRCDREIGAARTSSPAGDPAIRCGRHQLCGTCHAERRRPSFGPTPLRPDVETISVANDYSAAVATTDKPGPRATANCGATTITQHGAGQSRDWPAVRRYDSTNPQIDRAHHRLPQHAGGGL